MPGCRAVLGWMSEPLELSDELLDALLAGARTAEEIAGPDGLLGQLTRRLLNRALEAELIEHLGYEAGAGAARRRRERAQRQAGQDDPDRSGAAADPLPAGSQGHV